jgi:hypothetical protein
MLQVRVEGDPAESQALLDVLAAAGVEVQVGTRKTRREGFTHTYAMVRLAGWRAPAADAPDAGGAVPGRRGAVWAEATLGTPPALPAGDRRPARRGRPR